MAITKTNHMLVLLSNTQGHCKAKSTANLWWCLLNKGSINRFCFRPQKSFEHWTTAHIPTSFCFVNLLVLYFIWLLLLLVFLCLPIRLSCICLQIWLWLSLLTLQNIRDSSQFKSIGCILWNKPLFTHVFLPIYPPTNNDGAEILGSL